MFCSIRGAACLRLSTLVLPITTNVAARAGYGSKKNEGKNTRYPCTQRQKKRLIFGLNALTWRQIRMLIFFLPSARIVKRLNSDAWIVYLVGTPKGRLTKLEADLLERPWQSVRPGVEVKVLPQENELYVFAQSHARVHKERAMRRRQLKALWKRLGQLQQMKLTARELLLRLGQAKGRYRAAWRLIELQLPEPTTEEIASFSFALNRQKLRQIRRREGRYLLRTNLCGRDPAQLWQFYIQLVEIEAAFKNLKDDLALRPIYHQLEHRIEAHIFVAFMAYCLHVTLRARLRPLAPRLTPYVFSLLPSRQAL